MTDRLEYILFSIFAFLVRLMPLRVIQAFGRFLGSFGYVIARRRRRIAIDNLTHAFPEKSEKEIKRIALGAFQNYVISITEFLWFPRLTPQLLRRFVRILNIDVFGEAYRKGKGVVLMSAHIGNWELIALSGAYFSGYPVTIIVQTQRNRLVDRVINRYRCMWGNSVVSMESSVREVLRRLSDGQGVAMLADQSAPMEGLYVTYFGRPAATHQGPAIFSLRTGAPIVMGFLIRQHDNRYNCIYEEVRTDDLVGYSEENVAELTRRHVALLEKYVRMYPDQWLWMHRRWKHVDKASGIKAETLSTSVSSEPSAHEAKVAEETRHT